MKEKIHTLKEENNDLQAQLQQLEVSKQTNDDKCTGDVSNLKPENDILKLLKERIASQISDDGVSLK